ADFAGEGGWRRSTRRYEASRLHAPANYVITALGPMHQGHSARGGTIMLSIHAGNRHIHRRAFLQIGSLALGGLTLPGLLDMKARAAESRRAVTDRSVIFLFLHGGPSQTETFDPKMSAPDKVRSATGELPTRLAGVTFGSTFPRLAGLADRLSIVRSFV